MGLDMYLYKRVYVRQSEYTSENRRLNISVNPGKDAPKINLPEISYVLERVAEWRKFNALHGLILRKTNSKDNCRLIEVETTVLSEILEVLKKVKESLDKSEKKLSENGYIESFSDTSVAMKLLPPVSGVFFGSQDVDQWYYDDVSETIPLLEDILKDDDADGFMYCPSW